MTSGNWSSRSPRATSAAACWIASASCGSSSPRRALTRAAASLMKPKAWTTSIGIRSLGPNGKLPIDRPVVELGDRRERHPQGRRHSAERQADGEHVVLDLQIPEAVLDDDRHLVGKAFDQMLGDRHSRQAGLEGDVEMVAARKRPRLLDLAKHPA